MRSRNQNASYFNDDFEVTYEDDITFEYDTDDTAFETQEIYSRRNYDNTFDDNAYSDAMEAYDSDYDTDYQDHRRIGQRTSNRRRRKRRLTQLAAPIQKGGNTVIGFASTLIRNLTLFLMLAILIFMGYNFLLGSTPYGDIENAVASNTYTMTLASYFSVVAVLMFYEIISMLWAMTRARVRDEYGLHRKDVGRGMFSFIFLYICSHISFFVSDLLPDAPEILKGLKGALTVFGSMHNVLFGLCLAGVISCLIRKYSITL